MRILLNIAIITLGIFTFNPNMNAQALAQMPTGEKLKLYTQQDFTWNFNLDNGHQSNTDRDYTFQNLPEFLKGSTYIMTAMNDKGITPPRELYKMQCDNAITYYVGYDQRFSQLPNWLKNWQNTQQTYNYGGNQSVVYKLEASPNQVVVFGANKPSAQSSGNAMYSIFMQPAMVNLNNNPMILGGEVNVNGYILVSNIIPTHEINTPNGLSGTTVISVKEGPSTPFQTEQQQGKSKAQNNGLICTTSHHEFKQSSDEFYFLKDNRDAELFPGNILNISDIQNGNFNTSTTVPSNFSYNIATNVRGAGQPSALVQQRTYSAYQNALSKIFNPNNISYLPNSTWLKSEVTSVKSELDFVFKTKAEVSYLVGSGSGSFNYSKNEKRNTFLVEVTKEYFKINVDAPFKSNLPQSSANMDDLVYVSSVSYGQKIMLQIHSDYSKEKVESTLNASFDVGLYSLKYHVSAEEREILENMKVEAIALGGSDSGLATLIKNPSRDGIADLFYDSSLPYNTAFVPLSYHLKFLKSGKNAHIETYANYTQQHCKKLENYVKLELKDFYIIESDDASGGEEIYGTIDVNAPYHGKQRVLDRNNDDQVMHKDAHGKRAYPLRPYLKNQQTTYYFKYNPKQIYDEDHKIRISIHLKEDDSGQDMDMKRVEHEFNLKDIFSGNDHKNYTQVKALKTWYSNTEIKRESHARKAMEQLIADPHCQASPHSGFDDSNTKVMLRYIIKPVDRVPSNYKIGFK